MISPDILLLGGSEAGEKAVEILPIDCLLWGRLL